MSQYLAGDGFPARLSLALQACNLSRSQLPSMLGVHKSMVSRWLSGEMKPSGYNLARISTEIAKRKPGFDMRLWTAPRAEFDATLGLAPSGPATPSPCAAESLGRRPEEQVSVVGFARWRAAIAAAAVVILLAAASAVWRIAQPARDGDVALPSVAASVAVLPFLNMSGDSTKDYLGDGIAEEILNDLANTPHLRVASRTSSFSFRGRQADIHQIARKLNVRAVLEGSVRQQGNRVRIVAQLIDAKDGFHLWSARYDRKLDDVLSVQDEIAKSITEALDRKLVIAATWKGARRLRQRIDPNAYTAFLQGRYEMHKAGGTDFLRAADYFEQAIRLQPDYAEAHAMLALNYIVLYTDEARRDTLAPAQKEAAVALRLDPDNFWALLANAQVDRLQWRWREAEAAMQKLLRRRSNSAEAHHFHAVLFEGLGLWDRSVGEQRRAAELDPLVPAYRDNVGQALHMLRRDAEARVEFQKVLRLEPNFVMSLGNICSNFANAGKLREARQVLERQLVPLYPEDPNRVMCEVSIARREHDRKHLQAIAEFAERLYRRGALDASYLPFPYAYMGDYDRATKWLQKSYDDREYGVFYAMEDPDLPPALKQFPRWRMFVRQPGFVERARARMQITRSDSG